MWLPDAGASSTPGLTTRPTLPGTEGIPRTLRTKPRALLDKPGQVGHPAARTETMTSLGRTVSACCLTATRLPGAVSSSQGGRSLSTGCQVAFQRWHSLGRDFYVVQRSLATLWPSLPSWSLRLKSSFPATGGWWPCEDLVCLGAGQSRQDETPLEPHPLGRRVGPRGSPKALPHPGGTALALPRCPWPQAAHLLQLSPVRRCLGPGCPCLLRLVLPAAPGPPIQSGGRLHPTSASMARGAWECGLPQATCV